MKHVLGGFAFIVIWCAFCFGQAAVFNIETDAYLMAYGYIAGLIGKLLQDGIISAFK